MNTQPILAVADLLNSEEFLKTMAMVFTVLSGIASIVLTLSKFGLGLWKKVTLTGSVLGLGLVMVIFFLTKASSLGPKILSAQDTRSLSMLASELGEYSAGFTKTDAGIVSRPVRGEVTRVSEYIFAVMHPDGKFDAIYSGDYFPADINGTKVNCELIDIGGDRVVIVKGQQTEIIDLKSDQSNNTFKVKKIPVKSA